MERSSFAAGIREGKSPEWFKNRAWDKWDSSRVTWEQMAPGQGAGRNLLLCWAFNWGGKWHFQHFLHPSFSISAHITASHNNQAPDGRMALKLKWCKMGSIPLLFLPFPHKGLAERSAHCTPAWKSWEKQGLHPTRSLSLVLHFQPGTGRDAWALAGSSMSSQLPAHPKSSSSRIPTWITQAHTHTLFLLTLFLSFRLSSNSFYLLSLTLNFPAFFYLK